MRRRTAIAAAALPLLLAAACGSQTSTTASPSSAANAATASADGIKVTGAAGAKPVVAFPAGKPPLTSSSKIILAGTGQAVKDGDILKAKVTIYDWDGKQNKASSSDYDQGHSEFVTVSSAQLPKALFQALQGAKPGGRVLAVVSKDNLSPEQITQAQSQGTDFNTSSQVLVIDVESSMPKAASGTAVDSSIDGVKVDSPGGEKAPTLTTKTDAKPPKDLVVKTLIKGSGPAVKADQMVLAHYTGKIWGTDKEFDSSWARNTPATFPLNQVIKGWSQGLTGVPVGSRVLISVPPDLGYGSQGNPQGGIKGTDTLVFLVDVLGAV
ncbi:peptidylprolyl isomerase [Planotetraspora thailandica]|uniref:peptidylprolyl isomerase n=1 Tax=Planotetraspora thailandica TaxID=487172 RepID=A0A8J3XWK3_9ACTN|nr:FKBP-type peptidyl-prolyl cis-trans isomerase [Planotetraspora thailandica]GII51813.1 peptidylprolyl isomerase [Planotetraspora thailandica]